MLASTIDLIRLLQLLLTIYVKKATNTLTTKVCELICWIKYVIKIVQGITSS